MKKFKKFLKYIIGGSVFIIIIFMIMLKIFFYLCLPDIDGTFHSKEISKETKVLRDQWGIPHIYAENGKDAFFAYGFTVAQDRLFQIEMQSRLARGELAEILGPSLLETDKKFRTYLFSRTAKQYLEELHRVDPEALELADAFIAGINHFVETQPAPSEFTILGIKPRKFSRLDSMAMMGYMAYSFADGIDCDSMYSLLEEKFPGHDISELFPGYTREKPVSIMESQAFYNKKNLSHSLTPEKKDDNLFSSLKNWIAGFNRSSVSDPDELIKLFGTFDGSNSWVIAPSRSKSGRAILANDPHVALANPGVWYEAHIKYPGYENYGYFLPTLPFPVMGHNKHKAWGITMFENDDLDLYHETFHPDNKNLVKYRGKWTKVKIIREKIRVKGQEDVELEIRVTPHGPVITDFIDEYEGKPVSMFWVYHNVKYSILDFAYRAGNAKNVKEFEKAASLLAAPGLNLSYADKDGNIGWWAAGRCPIRPAHVNGKKVLDGASGRDEILGYLPFSQNPHLVNPASGIIVTANNKSTVKPAGPIKDLEGYWCSTDRAARITELLSSREKWSLEELQKVQTNLKSISSEPNSSTLITILEKNREFISKMTENEKEALAALKRWDCIHGVDSVGATIYSMFIYHVFKEALEDEIGKKRFVVYCDTADHWNALKALIKNSKSKFWDNIKTDEKETRTDVVKKAFSIAVAELEEKLGSSVNDWQWGEIHKIEWVHPIGMQKPMNLIFNIGPYPSPGEAHMINRLKSNFGKHDYRVTSVPSHRKLVDYSDLGKSFAIQPSGNSGNHESDFYDDQVEMYLSGKYRIMNFTDEQIKKNTKHEMIFKPGK